MNMSQVNEEYNSWKFSTCTSLLVTGCLCILYVFFNQLFIETVHSYLPLIVCALITFVGSSFYIRYAITYAWPQPKSLELNDHNML